MQHLPILTIRSCPCEGTPKPEGLSIQLSLSTVTPFITA